VVARHDTAPQRERRKAGLAGATFHRPQPNRRKPRHSFLSRRCFALCAMTAGIVAGAVMAFDREWLGKQASSPCYAGIFPQRRPRLPLVVRTQTGSCSSPFPRRAAWPATAGQRVGLDDALHAVEALVSFLNSNFAAWLAAVSLLALRCPHLLDWVRPEWFTSLLSLLMLSVGVTTSFDDFRASARRKTAVALNFIACYGFMPTVAYAMGRLIQADPDTLAGLVLIGAINGGHTSNLCTLIAGGDVALSVLMTMSTTAGCILMTPSICKGVIGTVVKIDAVGIALSTLQVVLLPTIVGLALNALFPKTCKRVASITPAFGVFATVLIVGSSVASCREYILTAGWQLQGAIISLHLLGGIVGYLGAKLARQSQQTCRTVAIETSMKSSAVGYLLASLHFSSFAVRVPAAVSVIWSAVVGGLLAAYWRRFGSSLPLEASH